MPQSEYVPRDYVPIEQNGSTQGISSDVRLESSTGDSKFLFSFETLRPGLFRTTFTSSTHPLPPHPSTVCPSRDFGGLKPSSTSTAKSKTIALGDVSATVEWDGCPIVTLQLAGREKPIHRDLDFRSYVVDSTGIAHYTKYKRDTLHVGLGEKAAPMNLSNRNFIISATDCFGYGMPPLFLYYNNQGHDIIRISMSTTCTSCDSNSYFPAHYSSSRLT